MLKFSHCFREVPRGLRVTCKGLLGLLADGKDFGATVLQLLVLGEQILPLPDKSVDLSLYPGNVGESFTSLLKVVVEIDECPALRIDLTVEFFKRRHGPADRDLMICASGHQHHDEDKRRETECPNQNCENKRVHQSGDPSPVGGPPVVEASAPPPSGIGDGVVSGTGDWVFGGVR